MSRNNSAIAVFVSTGTTTGGKKGGSTGSPGVGVGVAIGTGVAGLLSGGGSSLFKPFSGTVLTPPLACAPSYDPFSGQCKACAFCGTGDMIDVCESLFEVQMTPTKPAFKASLKKGMALCLNPKDAVKPPNGGAFRPGAKCIGKVFMPPASLPHIIMPFGCSK